MSPFTFADLLIRHIYRFFEEWQRHIHGMPRGPDRDCHEQVLRLCKGIVKAFRFWRDERRSLNA